MTWWRHRYTWATLSFAAVLIANIGGLAVGDDGIGYSAVADSLRNGRGLGYFLEPHLTIWPPGWPVLMAAVSKVTTLNSEGSAALLNAITAAVLVILANRLFTRLVKSADLILIGTAVVAIGASSMVFGHLLMTDFAFAAITVGLMLALLNFADSQSPRWLLGAAALVGGGFMIRYAGVVNIATGTGWLLIQGRRPVAQRIRNAIVFAAASAIIPAIWIVRNLSVDDTALGVRYGSARGLLPNTFDTLATIGNFLTPGVAIDLRTVWAAVGLAGSAVMAAMLWRLVRSDDRFTRIDGLISVVGTGPGLLAAHVVIYLAYMLYARTTTGLNQLDFRLLNPAYLPLVGTGLVILDRVILHEGAGSSPWASAARTIARAWGVVNIVIGIAMVAYFATSPDLFDGNYERPAYVAVRESDAIDALPKGCELSANAPNGLYEGGIESQWSPRITGPESNDPVNDIGEMTRSLATQRQCLIWVDLPPRWGHLATLAQLRQHFVLRELGHDGVVTTYEILRKG